MKLSAYMAENQLSRSNVAEHLGVSVEVVRQWMIGERRPRDEDVIGKIFAMTNGAVTPNDFYLPDSVSPAPSQPEAAE